MQIHNQICNLLCCWTERRTWKPKRKSPGSFQISLALKKNKYVLEQGFLAFKLSNIFYMRHRDWSNPSTSWWTVTSLHSKNVLQFNIVLRIERTRNQPPYCLLQLQEKKKAFRLPRSGCLGTPLTLPQSLYERTDGWTYADVRTKIFRINGLPNLLAHGAPRGSAIKKVNFQCVVSIFDARW